MAPEKGGGGIVSLSFGAVDDIPSNSSSNRCANSSISEPTVVARLVVDGFCLVVALLLIWFWLGARKRTPSVKLLLPWKTFGVLLALSVAYLILGVLLTVLGNCGVIGPLGAAEISVPASVASDIANILLLGIILLPLTRRLLSHNERAAKIVTTVNSFGIFLISVVFVPSIVLSNMASIYKYTSGINDSSKSLIVSLSVKFSLAFYTIYFVVALVGSLFIVLATWFKTSLSSGYNPTDTKVWVAVTIAALLFGSGSVVVEMFGWSLPSHSLSSTAWIAFLAVFNVFFIITVFAVLETAQAIAVPTVDPKDNATYDPESPEEVQPAVHKRFTYTGIIEIPLPQLVRNSTSSAWPLASGSPRWPLSSPSRANFGFGQEPPSPVQHAF